MKRILISIAEWFVWLFEDFGFRFFDSYTNAARGEAWVELRNSELTIRFVTDRYQVYLEFSPNEGWPRGSLGVTVDLLSPMLGDGLLNTTTVNSETVNFVRNRFSDISKILTETDPDLLQVILAKQEQERAKRLFG